MNRSFPERGSPPGQKHDPRSAVWIEELFNRAPTSATAAVLAPQYRHRVLGSIDIPADRFVVLDGVRFHYLDWSGDGNPLLLQAGLHRPHLRGAGAAPE